MNDVKSTNKLIYEKSPYLLQHANNPVNWYPWNDEVFTIAKNKDLPIFLSIGYSTCHWCHVMAHESFEDLEVAEYLNENYLCIKVDREERPDIDSIYMSVCQAITGSGGWPLSVIIDNHKHPIFAGTYFPKNSFIELLKWIKDLWDNNRDKIEDNTRKIVDYLNTTNIIAGEAKIELCYQAIEYYLSNFDWIYGGISQTPKFPTPHNWLFMMKYYQCTKSEDALKMVIKTLDMMRSGGIYDQLGFGFCRYSTDRKWLVPHFEKMIYDNTLLIITYLEGYKIVKDERYLSTAKEIADYLLRKMYSNLGGFYTAEDADSEGKEGEFYLFTKTELQNLLGENADKYINYFNVTDNGNFEGKNILNLIGKRIAEEDYHIIEECREIIFDYQNMRIHPLIDKKILTSYNGLAIWAFSLLGRITKEDKYSDIAKRNADFILQKMLIDNKLMARYIDGEVKYLGYDEDYAYVIAGLIELYQTTFDDKYLNNAVTLNDIFINQFYDFDNGGFFQTDKDSEVIVLRKKEIYDGATPSANSVAIYNLLRLHNLTDNYEYLLAAKKSLNYFAKQVQDYPAGYSFYLLSLLYKEYGSNLVTLVAKEKEDIKEILEIVNQSNLPFLGIKYQRDGEYQLIDNKPTCYLCHQGVCRSPLNDLQEISEIMNTFEKKSISQ